LNKIYITIFFPVTSGYARRTTGVGGGECKRTPKPWRN